MMKRIVLLGAPGSGKGTWSKILSESLSLLHISSGDLFRMELANDTALGREVRSCIEQGALVPDEVTIQLVKKSLVKGRGREGFILDGFPRTIRQAEALDEILDEAGLKIDAVVDLAVDEETLIERTLSRLVCLDCGQPYNTTTMKPKVEGVCDVCGGKVVRRSDDTEETVQRRLKAYHEQTEPLIDYYEAQGKLLVFANTAMPGVAAQREMLALLGLEAGTSPELDK